MQRFYQSCNHIRVFLEICGAVLPGVGFHARVLVQSTGAAEAVEEAQGDKLAENRPVGY